MSDRLIGAHMPTTGGLHKAMYAGKEIGCNAIQVFTASPRMWTTKSITEPDADLFMQSRSDTGIDAVVSHDSYLVNLAAPKDETLTKSISSFIAEMHRCHTLKIPYVVSHMGSHLGSGEEAGLKLLSETVKRVLTETEDDVSIAMETTAGQGTNLGYKFEHLAEVIERNNGNERLAVCLDTCHIFAAGYDITTKESFDDVINRFDSLIGLDRLKVIHANDALKGLASRVDRHAHIGEGALGIEPFRWLVNEQKFFHVPIIIEIPDEKRFAEQIALLRSLIV